MVAQTHGDPLAGGHTAPQEDEETLVQQLRAGEEAAFVTLLERHHAPLLRFLRNYLPTAELADDIAQETWLAVLTGIDRFEARSSLRTWIFRIGANRAQTRMRREGRSVSFSALEQGSADHESDAADIEQLLPRGFSHDQGRWSSMPARWEEEPETRLLSDETVELVRETVQELPPMQAAVITLRDIEGWTSAEVREALDLTEGNQRVLLHRARMRVRKALESHLEGGAQ